VDESVPIEESVIANVSVSESCCSGFYIVYIKVLH
jgi:hypothetical protein